MFVLIALGASLCCTPLEHRMTLLDAVSGAAQTMQTTTASSVYSHRFNDTQVYGGQQEPIPVCFATFRCFLSFDPSCKDSSFSKKLLPAP